MRTILNKKGQQGGVVSSTVMGIGALVIGTIVILVVVSTLGSTDLLGGDTTVSKSVTNESGAWLNASHYPFDSKNASTRNFVITNIVNASSVGVDSVPLDILSGNYTVSATDGTMTNASTQEWLTVNVSYTYDFVTGRDQEQATVDNLTANFTLGIGKVAQKIPDILTIVAVVFLLGALVLLWLQARRMGIFGSGGGSL